MDTMHLDWWLLAGSLAWAGFVTIISDWLVLGYRRAGFHGVRGLARLSASLIWVVLLFAAGTTAARYIERVPRSMTVAGYIAFLAVSFGLSLVRAAVYRRAMSGNVGAANSRDWSGVVEILNYLLVATAAYLLAALVSGRTVQLILILPLWIGALLPDLDTPFSAVGRLVPRLSRWIAGRFGHAQAWRSIGIAGLLALATTPLTPWLGIEACTVMPLGFLTHILLDALRGRGAMLLWPITRTVYAARADSRTFSGPAAERRLAAALVVLVVVLLLLVDIGPQPAPPVAAPSYEQSLRTYQSVRGRRLALADVSGTWQATGKPVYGRFEILSAAGSSLIMQDRYTGRIFSAGREAADNLYLDRLTVTTGDPVRVKPVEIHLEDQSLRDALHLLYEMQAEPGLQHIFVSGDLVLNGAGSGHDSALRADLSQTSLRRILLLGPGHFRLEFLAAMELIELADVQVDVADLVIVATYVEPSPGTPTATPLPSPQPATGESP